MTRTNPDKITPEEWRTAAKVARRSIFGNNELADAWDNVAKYSAAADLATQLAKAYIDALHRSGLTHNTWAYLPDAQRTEIRHGMQFVLAHLRSTGRLIPAGGMALTAEQVEDVRTYIDCAAKCGVGSDNGVAARLHALFPATEPADDFVCYEGDAKRLLGRPTPAEPAEEETKAEPSTRQIADVIVEGRSQNMSWMQIAEMVKQVFFPTETGPWQDWPSLDAIPADVRTVWDKAGDEYRRTNGGWKFRSPGGKWQQITLPLDDYIDYAPFTTAAVAVWDPELGTRNDWTLNEGDEQ